MHTKVELISRIKLYIHYPKIGAYGIRALCSKNEKGIRELVVTGSPKNKSNARKRYPYTHTFSLPIPLRHTYVFVTHTNYDEMKNKLNKNERLTLFAQIHVWVTFVYALHVIPCKGLLGPMGFMVLRVLGVKQGLGGKNAPFWQKQGTI